MKTVVKDVKSKWRKVDSGVTQGLVLAPVLFLIYMNDMPEGVKLHEFADDAKLQRHIRNSKDCEILQGDLNKIWNWSEKQMEFNMKKYHVMKMGENGKR